MKQQKNKIPEEEIEEESNKSSSGSLDIFGSASLVPIDTLSNQSIDRDDLSLKEIKYNKRSRIKDLR